MHLSRRSIFEFVADALFPRQCYQCKQADTFLCQECCLEILQHTPETVCPHCSTRVPYGKLQQECYNNFLVNKLFIATTYQNQCVKKMFMDFKYRRAKALAHPLAALLVAWLNAHRYNQFQNNSTVVVPVPSHKSREKDRGFHPATALAQQLAIAYQLPLATNIVRKHKNIGFQTHIKNAQQRRKNVEGCFTLAPQATQKTKQKTILLVDDIITTGSTMRECAKTLRTARPKEIIGLAVAKQGLE